MRKQLLWLPKKILGSFWFVPLVLALAGWGCGLISVAFDQSDYAVRLAKASSVWAITVDGGRSLVSTVAGGIVTMASLVFSLTFVALTLMSQQLGPRLIQLFIRDRFAKLTFGAFSGAFLFCLAVLAVTGTGDKGNFVPIFSMFVVIILAVASFCLMIIYINHIAVSIQADTLIVRLGGELINALSRLEISASDDPEADDRRADDFDIADDETATQTNSLCATVAGYIAQIDEKSIVGILQKNDLQGRLLRRPGHFLTPGMPLLVLNRDIEHRKDELAEKIQDAIIVEQTRSASESGEFEINALVEVALRALSPGLNDSYTALACIDQLTMALGDLLKAKLKPRLVCDDHGKPRLLLYNQNFEHFIDTAFHPIRHAARDNPLVLARLVNSCRLLLENAREPEWVDSITSHLESLEETIRNNVSDESDRGHLLSNISRNSGKK